MKPRRTHLSAAVAILFALAHSLTHAEGAANFVDDMASLGMAEILISQSALAKSEDPQVRQFAQRMIAYHERANAKLVALARSKGLPVANDKALANRAKQVALQYRQGEDFDMAYVENQAAAHEQAIQRLGRYLEEGGDAELVAFAKRSREELERHLEMTQELQRALGAEE